MKKFILGILTGAILLIPVGAFAWDKQAPAPNDIYEFNCATSNSSRDRCNRIAVLDDRDNKCYVSYDTGGYQTSISCVKK